MSRKVPCPTLIFIFNVLLEKGIIFAWMGLFFWNQKMMLISQKRAFLKTGLRAHV